MHGMETENNLLICYSRTKKNQIISAFKHEEDY